MNYFDSVLSCQFNFYVNTLSLSYLLLFIIEYGKIEKIEKQLINTISLVNIKSILYLSF